MNKTYVVLGAKGYVGRRFVRFLQNKKQDVVALSHDDVDYTDSRVFENWLTYNAPRWNKSKVYIINCAGKTGRPNVDQCEIKRADTIDLNVVLPSMLSDACERHGHVFCHVSSGCIYQGGATRVFTEEDKPNFGYDNKSHSFYSGSKALAEQHVIKNKTSYIWRIRMPFDERNVERSYLAKLIKYDRLIDATNSLTHLGDFIRSCFDMTQHESPYGIYNMVNAGGITTREIVDIIKQELNIKRSFEFFDSLEQFGTCVKTPRSNCVISSDKVNSLVGVTPMRPIEDALRDALKNWC